MERGFIPFRAGDEYTEIDGEFYLAKDQKTKKRKKNTKDTQMLGIWGEDSEDNSSENSEEKIAKGAKYSRPMTFVSKIDQQSDNEDNFEEGIEEIDGEKFVLPQREIPTKPQTKTSQINTSSAGIPPTVGKKYSASSSNQPHTTWEKYSTGFGSKLLQKMGWKDGEGLGKDGTGIVAPIEVIVRPKNQGLSYKGFQERTQQSLQDFNEQDAIGFRSKNTHNEASQKETKAEYIELPSYWKKDKQKRPKKTIYEATSAASKPNQKQKILDLRGPNVVVLDSYDGVVSKPVKVPYLPELYHNLQILVEMKQLAIHNAEQSSKSDILMTQRLLNEEKKISLVIEVEEEKISRLEDVLELVEKCTITDGSVALDDLLEMFEDFQTLYLPQWQQYELISLAFHSVFPLFRKLFEFWDPIQNPYHGLEIVRSWRLYLDPAYAAKMKLDSSKQILIDDVTSSPLQGMADFENVRLSHQHNYKVNAYHRLFEDIIFPIFKKAIMYDWDAILEPQKAIVLISSWIQVVPPHTTKNIIDNVVLVKLKMEVDKWNPRAATKLVSDWIHPWFSLISSEAMLFLWNPISDKLVDALRQWNPTDQTAFCMLHPWKKVLPVSTFDSFLQRSILPKFKIALQSFQINPANQDMKLWNEIIRWNELFLPETIIALLYNEFFPKWFDILYTWLTGTPNLAEVSKWYMSWKSLFPENIRNDPNIVQQFNTALDIMQSSMIPNSKVKVPPKFPKLSYTIKQHYDNNGGARKNNDKVIDVDEPTEKKVKEPVFDESKMTFKEIIESLAKEYGIIFIPTKRTHDSKIIYNFGKASIYFDKNILYCQKQGRWAAVGIDSLLETANG